MRESKQGRSQRGKQGNLRPLPKPKNCCKMMLFPKALFLVRTFPKIVKKFKFPIEFSSKIFKIFSKFPNNVFFIQTREIITHGLLTSLKIYS